MVLVPLLHFTLNNLICEGLGTDGKPVMDEFLNKLCLVCSQCARLCAMGFAYTSDHVVLNNTVYKRGSWGQRWQGTSLDHIIGSMRQLAFDPDLLTQQLMLTSRVRSGLSLSLVQAISAVAVELRLTWEWCASPSLHRCMKSGSGAKITLRGSFWGSAGEFLILALSSP